MFAPNFRGRLETLPLLSLLAQWPHFLRERARTHPRTTLSLTALVLSVLGSGAWAVANWEDAPSSLTQVSEPVHVAAPLTEVSPGLLLYRSDVTRSSDTAESLFGRLGLNDPEAANYVREVRVAKQQLLARAGRLVHAEADAQQHLQRLTLRWPNDDGQTFSRWVLERTPDGLRERTDNAPLTATTRSGFGTIQSSLFAATDEADIPDAVASQLAEIFSGDIDFHRHLRKGDRFAVVYESLEADGEPLRTGRVLSAEFVNNGKVHQAFWFREAGAKTGAYYNAEGVSMRRTYLASPLAFSRMTSGFKMRFHPILQTWRAHLGVDYAAPTGTPVRSVGAGVVDVAGVQGGFGNVVMVKHGNGHTTVYAHLSKIQVRTGQRIEQGQTVGLVGATGWATGPHLHFEFRVNGQHKDPATLARQSTAVEVSAAARAEFKHQLATSQVELAAASQAASSRE